MTPEERKLELEKLTEEKRWEMHESTAQNRKEDQAQKKREGEIKVRQEIKAREEMEQKMIKDACKLREIQEKIAAAQDVIIEEEFEEETKEEEKKPVRDVCPKEPSKCTCLQFTVDYTLFIPIRILFLVLINHGQQFGVHFNKLY